MGLMSTFYDFLGRRLSLDGSVTSTSVTEAMQKVALMEHARMTAIDVIAMSLAKCDFKFYDGSGQTLDNAAWLWNVAPNPDQNHVEFIEALVSSLYYDHGEALVIPYRSRGTTCLYVADGFTKDTTQPVGSPMRFNDVTVDGKPVTKSYTSNTAFYFRLRHDDDFIALERSVSDVYEDLCKSVIKAFKRRNGRKYKLTVNALQNGDPDEQAKQDAAIKAALDTFMNNDDVVYRQMKNYDLSEFQTAATSRGGDASTDFVSLKKDIYETVAIGYHMPVSLLYGNTNNFDSVFDAFMSFAIDPLARMIGEVITADSVTPDAWSQGARCALDTSGIRHVDLFEIADAADKLRSSTCFNPDEIRARVSYDPEPDGIGQEYALTKNYEIVGGGNNDQA
jgi:HK97 family phage portal protein